MEPNNDIIKREILRELNDRKVPRQCGNCTKWARSEKRCSACGRLVESFMFCPDHEFETERLERRSQEAIAEEQKECEKIENLLALMLTLANMVTCVAEDFGARTRKLYDKEKDKETRLLLRKDMNISEDVTKAFKAIQEHLRKIEQQYSWYVYPHEKRVVSKKGKFDVEKSDGHLGNAFELLRGLMKMIKKALGMERGMERIFEFLDTLPDSPYYALEEKDIEHYKLK